MVCFLRQSWHGGSWCDSASPFLAQNKLYRNASMLAVAGLVAHNLHTNSSNFTCKFGGRFHCTPSCANASLNSAFAFNIVSARILHFPANALTVSLPVKACIPSNALHTSGPMDATTFEISMKRVRVWMPHFETVKHVIFLCILSLNARQTMKILVSSALITSASIPSLDAWAAWSSTRPSASSCRIDVAGTSLHEPWVIFQHLSRFMTYRHFPTNLSVYFYFFHTFSRNRTVSSWVYCRIAAITSSTVSLIVYQICSAVVGLDHHPERVHSTFVIDMSL